MKTNYDPSQNILTRYFLFILLSFSFFFISAQEKERSYCGTIPLEDAYLRDPFYENSEGLLEILRDNGYDMPMQARSVFSC